MSDSISLPARLQSGGTAWKRCLEVASEIERPERTTLDASALTFAQPYGIVTLGAALLRRRAAGAAPLRFVPPRDLDARLFLSEIGLEQLLADGTTPTSPLAIRLFSPTSVDPSATRLIATTIERLVPGTSESVAHVVELSLNELLQNVAEHARSVTATVVHARWYRQQENLRLAVGDSGVGMAESLRDNPIYEHMDDRRLVERAVADRGVSRRTSGKHGGYGLKTLRDIVLQRGGSMSVSTGAVFARLDGDRVRTEFAVRLHGTSFRPLPDDGSRAVPAAEEFF